MSRATSASMLLAAAVLMVMAPAALARPIAARSLLQAPTIIVPNTTGVELYGFTMVSEAGVYTLIPKDTCDMATALSAATPDFATAIDIYENGKNAPGRNGTFRALKAFATGIIYGTPSPFRLQYIEHYNDQFFMDAAVEEALSLTPASLSAQVLKLVPQNLILLNYIMHETEAGLNKTVSRVENNTDPARGAPHNLDEAWGIYAGTGSCGVYPQVNAMSRAFGLMRDAADGKTCESAIHRNILTAFKNMQAAALAGDAVAFKKGRDSLSKNLLVPYIQGTLKAAFEVSKRVSQKLNASNQLAQAYGYWRAIEAVVATADQAAADTISEAFFLDQKPAANTYAKVLAAFQSAYPKLGLSRVLIGTYGTKQYLNCDGSKPALTRCLAKCPKVAKLVCGADGKVYSTQCHAVCYGTTVRKVGRC